MSGHSRGLRVVERWRDLDPADTGAAVALGNFDGVHLGHRQVIADAAKAARSLGVKLGVITFEPHPRRWFQPDAPPFRLMTAGQQAEALAAHLGAADVSAALETLVGHYRGRGIELVERGRRWHFQTAPDLAHLLRREREEPRRLSRAATEVLAIEAYHEPVSRAEIESIRGVQTARGTLDVLIETGWVRTAGRREVPGRPML